MGLQPDRVKERRKALNMSQEALAELVGVRQAQISRYELSQDDITGSTLAALAQALSVSSDYLLGLTNDFKIGVRTESDLNPLELEVITALRTTKPGRTQAIVNIVREIMALE